VSSPCFQCGQHLSCEQERSDLVVWRDISEALLREALAEICDLTSGGDHRLIVRKIRVALGEGEGVP
jgi:hypothetical protein